MPTDDHANTSAENRPPLMAAISPEKILESTALIPDLLRYSTAASTPEKRVKVVLDIGHGVRNWEGKMDSGAVARRERDGKMIEEKDINQSVAEKLKALLEIKGYDVVFSDRSHQKTRKKPSDADFYPRAHSGPDAEIFLSLHSDVRLPPVWPENVDKRGIKVHLFASDFNDGVLSEGERFAETLQKDSGSPQIVDEKGTYGRFLVLKPSLHPQETPRALTALIEMGAMTDAADLEKLSSNDGQIEIASQIAAALQKVHPPSHPQKEIPAHILAGQVAVSTAIPINVRSPVALSVKPAYKSAIAKSHNGKN